MEWLTDILTTYGGEIGLALVYVLTNILGKGKKLTPEEKKAKKLARTEKKAAKQLAQVQTTMREVEELKKEE